MRAVPILIAAALLAACGGHATRTTEQTVRAWSADLNRGDDGAAASLFAPNAEVIQNGELVLANHRAALIWTRALPCGGHITHVTRRGAGKVLVIFHLTDRPHHMCDAPGQDAAAVFEVQRGRIVLWHQVPVPSAPPATTTAQIV